MNPMLSAFLEDVKQLPKLYKTRYITIRKGLITLPESAPSLPRSYR